MARYFFRYQYADEKLLEDRVGIELPDLEAVEEEARSVAIEILSEELLEEGASLTEPPMPRDRRRGRRGGPIRPVLARPRSSRRGRFLLTRGDHRRCHQLVRTSCRL